jgi:hypothetical protein
MTEWMRDVQRRIDILERRRAGRGLEGGVGGGGGSVVRGAAGWAGVATFVGGVATVGVSNTVQPLGALAGFSSSSSAVVNATATTSNITLRATVGDGSYAVTVLFLYA